LALQALERAGVIRTHRGGLSILDRRRLQFMAAIDRSRHAGLEPL
jgi:hypothetical protein